MCQCPEQTFRIATDRAGIMPIGFHKSLLISSPSIRSATFSCSPIRILYTQFFRIGFFPCLATKGNFHSMFSPTFLRPSFGGFRMGLHIILVLLSQNLAVFLKVLCMILPRGLMFFWRAIGQFYFLLSTYRFFVFLIVGLFICCGFLRIFSHSCSFILAFFPSQHLFFFFRKCLISFATTLLLCLDFIRMILTPLESCPT